MTKRDYIVHYLISTVCLHGNDRAINMIAEKIDQYSDSDISMFYAAVSVKMTDMEKVCSVLDDLYTSIFEEDVKLSLTPSQMACLWQGRFRFGDMCDGYIERDNYKDEILQAGERIYALVPDGYNRIPSYFFDETTFHELVGKTTMDVYAKLQINPFWSKGFGARKNINEYTATNDFEVAVAYAHNNHHLSREISSLDMLSEEEKKKKGIGQQHILIEPYDEDHCDYEYVVPPSKQIFVPDKCKVLLEIKKEKIHELDDDMTEEYKKVYSDMVMKAQKSKLDKMRWQYEINKKYNDLP